MHPSHSFQIIVYKFVCPPIGSRNSTEIVQGGPEVSETDFSIVLIRRTDQPTPTAVPHRGNQDSSEIPKQMSESAKRRIP
ncbi:hypothetical protein BLNAU_4779 [Blattamonas nauphoetae]|uniref:Uncharacterized protein n=1 Tax=Blattamonas nauphoetae TaxID=2049346 RepID=A0ABQ9Y901_9EUKA|nr:hypothetical protein BLNAU_4779 [Blattamonas nauphoetae]